MKRRELLKRAGVAGGAGAAGVASIYAYSRLDEDDGEEPTDRDNETRGTPPGELPRELAEQYGTVVDAASAGADPGGETPINDFLTEYAGEDTLLTFQPGTYRLQPAVLSGFSKLGLVGIGDERPTMVPVGTNCRPGDAHLMFKSVEDFRLENVDFDLEREGSGGSIHLFSQGDVTVRNVDLRGHCPEQISMFRVDVLEEDGDGTIENFVTREGNGDSGLTGVYVGRHHVGSLTFRDCDVRGFADNGLYASSPGHPNGGNGTVTVEGGTFVDNNIANVRLGSTGSVARDVSVVVESPSELDGSLNARGIRLREQAGHVIEGCDVHIGDGIGRSFGGIVFHPDAAEATIRDTNVVVDADTVHGINALEPSDSSFSGPLVENVSLSGSAESGYAASIEGRDGTVFRNCTIDHTGRGRGGIRFRNAEDCRIIDSEIRTDGPPIDLQRSAASIENTTVTTPDGTRSIESLDASDEVVAP